MNQSADYYKILQVHSDASQEMIDAAYRCLCKLYHPDVNHSPDASERMQAINAAYAVIGDARKRREYGRVWKKSGQGAAAGADAQQQAASSVFHRNRTENEEVSAKVVLDVYFGSMLRGEWERAYQCLTSADRSNVPCADFIEWKNAVSCVYKAGNYRMRFFDRYENCEYAGKVYPVILAFSVDLEELNLSTGKTSNEQAQKYVAREGGGWKVCLGYTDLKPSIRKYKCLAQAAPKETPDDICKAAVLRIDPLTGLFSNLGWMEQAEKEVLRSRTYGNPLSMAVITVKLPEDKRQDNALKDACISYVGGVLAANMRKTDTLGKYDEDSFAVIFAETGLKEAGQELGGLIERCEDKEYLSYEIGCSLCANPEKGDLREKLAAARNLAAKKIFAAKEAADMPSARLGKYKASDLLNFNRKWKNHY